MDKKGYSREGFFGEKIHYDENGKKIGESRRNLSGGYDHFDINGNKVGSSYENFWGGVNHYDATGEKRGTSYRGFCGQTNHYGAQGEKVGESVRNFSGGQNHYSTSNDEDNRQVSAETNGKGNPCLDKPAIAENSKPQNTFSNRRSSNGFDELLATVAVAGFSLFVLGAILRWENILLFLVVFIISLVWFIIRNK